MKKNLKIALIYLLLAGVVSEVQAQHKIETEGFFGHSYFINKNSGGYDLTIKFNYFLNKRSFLGISIGHAYADNSPFPSNLSEAKIVLKEESNRLPLGFGFQGWEKDSAWPGILLEEQPNRYFRFNLGLHYALSNILRNVKNFDIGLGALFSYKDESELIKMIETSYIGGLFVKPTFDHSIPIFQYNTYLDAGFQLDFTYSVLIKKSLILGYRSTVVIYPKSGGIIINNGIIFSIKRK